MNTIEIEENLDQLVTEVAAGTCSVHDFPFRVMEAYEASRNEVAKLRMKHPQGLAVSNILWPKKLLFRAADRGQVQNTIEALKASLVGKKGAAAKNAPRFVMSTDGDEFLAIDLKTGETPPFDRIAELPVNYDFLLPMFGVERYKPAPETTADVRAARHMAKFHDAIRDANPTWGAERIHDLNLFMTRLLFCMFAEDTGIFTQKLFVNTLRREAMQVDGSDTQRVVEDVFLSLDLADREARHAQGVRSQRIAVDFPYVNGGLFRDRTEVPVFNRRARRLLLEAADLQWEQIHADIFGSMIQAIVQTDMRADFGMHYTSVPNIMKVLEPLFLSSLREQLTAAGDNVKALEKLVERISRVRVFDPACGSGNFLIIAYRELRLIETEAFRRMRAVKRKGQLDLADYHTGIKISSFHGIDPVDFACETAKLSLWISQYQMNRKLDEICSAPTPALPLTDAGSIVVGNALRKDWLKVCPPSEDIETYVVGNPPYLGRGNQTPEQKRDIIKVFSPLTKKFKKLDYVACWFARGTEYLKAGGTAFAFVSTNSICQGEQVGLLWPHVIDQDHRIVFAHQAFKWANSAAKNAGVTCVIIGVGDKSIRRRLYSAERITSVDNINAYLAAAPDVIVEGMSHAQSGKPLMRWGNMPADGGALILSEQEREKLLAAYPKAAALIRPLYGTQELLDSRPRYCLWIPDSQLKLAKTFPPVAARIDECAAFRNHEDRDAGTQALAGKPHQFREMHTAKHSQIVVAMTASENRLYIPVEVMGSDPVISNLAFSIHDGPMWIFSIISSGLHVTWAKAVAGGLETRLRYSNTLVYNTFPMPAFSKSQQEALEQHALDIMRVREPYIADGRSLAWLYNPETMPAELHQTHSNLDNYLETIYIGRPFKDDPERLEHLFKLYARMTKTAAKAA
ncbi:class I SAM-dependent DNA methyltransferase [Sphingomonas oligophenolica]|uniref:site-specific DNA-methyltransferase (adenine-specific) n=1 Tax=Sphingomonas oligophenolica TaxID=301154 RepID=A0ABU9Y6L0_9SPHN